MSMSRKIMQMLYGCANLGRVNSSWLCRCFRYGRSVATGCSESLGFREAGDCACSNNHRVSEVLGQRPWLGIPFLWLRKTDFSNISVYYCLSALRTERFMYEWCRRSLPQSQERTNHEFNFKSIWPQSIAVISILPLCTDHHCSWCS